MIQKSVVDKRVGGVKRAEKAREFMQEVMQDPSHSMRFAKDIDFARKFSVSRHTIYKIRRDLQIPDRLDRIVAKLKSVDTSNYTMWELCSLLNVRYAGLYKIVKEHNLPVKSAVKSQPEGSSRDDLPA